MYFKIVRLERNPEHGAQSEAIGFEGDSYYAEPIPEGETIEDRPKVGSTEVTAAWPEHKMTMEVWIYGGSVPRQVFLGGATMYVMNDSGKTIDTIHS